MFDAIIKMLGGFTAREYGKLLFESYDLQSELEHFKSKLTPRDPDTGKFIKRA